MTNNPLVLASSCAAALVLVCAVSYCSLVVHLLPSAGERYLFRLEFTCSGDTVWTIRKKRRDPGGAVNYICKTSPRQ